MEPPDVPPFEQSMAFGNGRLRARDRKQSSENQSRCREFMMPT